MYDPEKYVTMYIGLWQEYGKLKRLPSHFYCFFSILWMRLYSSIIVELHISLQASYYGTLFAS
jgi:hypothetical protein